MRAIFIGGTGRCGTTILRRSFRLHPDCLTFDTELRVLVGPGGLLDLLDTFVRRWDPWAGDDAVNRFVRAAELHFAKGRVPPLSAAVARVMGMVTSRKHARLRRDTAWAFMYETTQLRTDQAQGVIDEFFDLLNEEGKTLVDDTPYNICHVSRILEWLPDAKFVHIIRHPREVLGSMSKMQWGAPTWDLTARRIAQVLRKGILAFDEHRIIQVKLEDLVDDPLGEMQLLCTRLDLPWHVDLVHVPIERTQVNKYRLDPAGRRAYKKHLAELAETLGYA